MKTIKQCEAAIAKYKWSESTASSILERLSGSAYTMHVLLAIAIDPKNVLTDIKACSSENSADVAIAKILGMRVKKSREMVFSEGKTYKTELYNRCVGGDVVPSRELNLDDVQAILEGAVGSEVLISTRKSAAKLMIEEEGEMFLGANPKDEAVKSCAKNVKIALKSYVNNLVAERQKEVIEFIEVLKAEEIKKILKIPEGFIAMQPNGAQVKSPKGGSEVIEIPVDEIFSIVEKYPNLTQSLALANLIKQDAMNADLKQELDKSGVKYTITNDPFGMKMIDLPELQSTIVMDGHDDDVARALKWMEGKPSNSETSTSDNPL